MSIFDDIEKKKKEDVQKAVEARSKVIEELREAILGIMKSKGVSVQDASIALKSCQDKINSSLIDKPLTDFI